MNSQLENAGRVPWLNRRSRRTEGENTQINDTTEKNEEENEERRIRTRNSSVEIVENEPDRKRKKTNVSIVEDSKFEKTFVYRIRMTVNRTKKSDGIPFRLPMEYLMYVQLFHEFCIVLAMQFQKSFFVFIEILRRLL